MSPTRSIYQLGLLVIAAAATAACGDSPVSIEEASFAASLEVDLGSMTQTASGLYLQDLTVGTGEPALAGNTATVTYVGWLTNGQVFDSGTFTFVVGTSQAIDGFDEGVTGMRVGGTRRIIVPPSLGYGDAGSGPIPGNAILVFRLTLDSVS